MKRYRSRSRYRHRRGASMVQYVVMLGLVAIPTLAAYALAGPKLADNLTRVGRSLLGIEEKP